MATRKVSLQFAIEKDAEYKQTLQEINKEHQVLASELKKVEEQYGAIGDKSGGLQEKLRILEEEFKKQSEKVVTLRQALENARDAFGDNDKRTQEWAIQLNNAEAAEWKLYKSILDTNEELEKQDDDLVGLGDAVGAVADKLGISIPDKATEALNGMAQFSEGTVALMGTAAAGVALVYKAVSELHELTLEAAAKADELLTRSAQTGIDVETLQGLDYASSFLDFDGIDQSLVKLTASMDKARDGAEKQAEAFATLGVSVTDTDGQLRSNWETFLDVIDALGEVENATERDALSNDLFGKSYSELKPLIDAGSDALKGYIDEAEESGLVMQRDQVEKLGEVDDAVNRNKAHWDALKNEIAETWAPASIEALNLFAKAADTLRETVENSTLLTSFEHLVESAENLGNVCLNLFDVEFPSFLDPISQFAGALDGLAIVVNGLASGLEWLESKAQSAVEWVRNLNAEMVGSAMAEVGDMGYNAAAAYNAAGDDNWRGGLTWVGDGGGPELVRLPQGSTIYPAQESRQIAAASATDTSRIEALLSRIEGRLERVEYELADAEAVRRMA